MQLRRSAKSMKVCLLMVAAVLVTSMATVAAAPAEETEERSAVFGRVVSVDGDVLLVRTKQGDVQLRSTVDTELRVLEGYAGAGEIRPGDRIAALTAPGDGFQEALAVLIVPQQVAMVHIIGVVAEGEDGTASIIAEDGRRITVEIGLNRSVPAPGTVVTVAGYADPNTGSIRARSIHRLDETLEQLSSHLDEIQDVVSDRDAQVHHLTRAQRMLEKTSERQLEILNKVIDYLPEEARPALEKALYDLSEANQAMLRAFSQALELAGDDEGLEPIQRLRDAHLPKDIGPSLEDLAGVLGQSEDALTDRLSQGLTLIQIAHEAGYTEEAFVEEVLARVRQRLDRLVDEGLLASADAEGRTPSSSAGFHRQRSGASRHSLLYGGPGSGP